jgi:hypothetical protein
MADPFQYSNDRDAPALDWVSITPGASALDTPVRAIRANTAGTVTVTTPLGSGRVMNFLAGETRSVSATHVTAATATGLEGAI